MALMLLTIGHWKTAGAGGEGPGEQPSAADLVREVYSSEAWIRQVRSCLLRTRGVQWKPARREATHSPTAEEFERLRGPGNWQEIQRWRQEIAWDATRVRTISDYAESGLHMATAWDGKTMTRHEKAPRRDRDCYGLYDDSRKDMLLSFRVNLWDNPGCVTRDLYAWWRSRDPEKNQASWFTRPEDFRLAGESLVDGRECHVVESRAGKMRLDIDRTEHRVRRITRLGVPNDLAEGVWLAAMGKAADVELTSSRDWRPWIETLDPERRLAAERKLAEEIFPSLRIHSEVYPTDHVEIVPGSWMPRRVTAYSSYPDWDAVERTGRYTYVVDRVEVEVTELEVDEPLSDELLAIRIPEGGKVYDWRFDPPAEYAFRKDRTADEIRAIAEEAKRKRDEETAPHREMAARIQKRVGQKAPELPRATWLNGDPLKLGDLRGKVILLHFWATWCAPCHDDIRTLVTRNSSATSEPIVIGIHDARADAGAVKRAIAEGGIKYPVCVDPERDGEDGVSQRSWYGIRGIPYAILIDREGLVAGHGALEDMIERAGAMR
jgi:hypothetical protein